MGVGPYPIAKEADADNINAGKVPLVLFSKPSLSYLEAATSPLPSLSLSLEEAI